MAEALDAAKQAYENYLKHEKRVPVQLELREEPVSHMVTVSIPDCRNLEAIKLRLEEEYDSDEDEAEITPWIATIDSIITQAYEDGR